MGKTRIALHAAHRSRADVRVGWVELAPIADPNAVLYATADALGVRELDAVDPIGSLVRALGDQPTLVVLDNCEHVVDVTAHLAEGLAQRCASVTVLATSREPLGVAGEILLPVAPLGTAEPPGTDGSPAFSCSPTGSPRRGGERWSLTSCRSLPTWFGDWTACRWLWSWWLAALPPWDSPS